MIDALFKQNNYLAAKKMLDRTVLRQEAIASNFANLETPHYKRLDVAPSFNQELQRAIASKNEANISSLRPSLSVDQAALAANRDGNTVQLETELMHMSQNSVEHALETQLISSSLARLRLAISGKS